MINRDDINGQLQRLAWTASQDAPFAFGQDITTAKPGPFTTAQLARLLVLRGRLATTRVIRQSDTRS